MDESPRPLVLVALKGLDGWSQSKKSVRWKIRHRPGGGRSRFRSTGFQPALGPYGHFYFIVKDSFKAIDFQRAVNNIGCWLYVVSLLLVGYCIYHTLYMNSRKKTQDKTPNTRLEYKWQKDNKNKWIIEYFINGKQVMVQGDTWWGHSPRHAKCEMRRRIKNKTEKEKETECPECSAMDQK